MMRLFSSSYSNGGSTGQRTFAVSAVVSATGAAALALWANSGQVSCEDYFIRIRHQFSGL
jgi:hypothetical protein